MSDSLVRAISTVRISVTPRCSLKQSYRITSGGKPVTPGNTLLRLEDIARLVGVYAGLGMRKVRLTGGEPLARKGICRLVADLKSIPGIEDVAINTNGVLLEKMIPELRAAGLDRVSISLDSLQPKKLKKIAGYDVRTPVMGAIRKIVRGGLWPLTINMAAIRGFNDDEVSDFADMASSMPIEVRYIEMMPTAIDSHTSGSIPLYMDEVEHEIRKKHTLIPQNVSKNGGPAAVYLLEGGLGRVSFISPIDRHSCEECDRLRITADGVLRTCIFDDHEIDLRSGFTNGENEEWLLKALYNALKTKSYAKQVLPAAHTGETPAPPATQSRPGGTVRPL